jgi:hypothetical protein
MGWEGAHPDLSNLFERLTRAYGFRAHLTIEALTYMGTYDKSGSEASQVQSFIRVLQGLGSGTWLFLEHPAYDDAEMAGLRHIAYEGVAKDRGDVTRVLTSPLVMRAVRELGIELISYRDLRCV